MVMWGFQKKEVLFGGRHEKDDATVENIVFPGLWNCYLVLGGFQGHPVFQKT